MSHSVSVWLIFLKMRFYLWTHILGSVPSALDGCVEPQFPSPLGSLFLLLCSCTLTQVNQSVFLVVPSQVQGSPAWLSETSVEEVAGRWSSGWAG